MSFSSTASEDPSKSYFCQRLYSVPAVELLRGSSCPVALQGFVLSGLELFKIEKTLFEDGRTTEISQQCDVNGVEFAEDM